MTWVKDLQILCSRVAFKAFVHVGHWPPLPPWGAELMSRQEAFGNTKRVQILPSCIGQWQGRPTALYGQLDLGLWPCLVSVSCDKFLGEGDADLCNHGFATAGWSVQENSLGLASQETPKQVGPLQRLHHLQLLQPGATLCESTRKSQHGPT